jgi:hypothetical protein
MLRKTHELLGGVHGLAVADWNRNDVVDLLVGAEDGYFYHLGR